MKKQLSVFALHARAAIGRLALVLLGMLALDAAAYVLFGLRGFRASLTGSELVTALRVIFSLGLVACQLLLAACFGVGNATQVSAVTAGFHQILRYLGGIEGACR